MYNEVQPLKIILGEFLFSKKTFHMLDISMFVVPLVHALIG